MPSSAIVCRSNYCVESASAETNRARRYSDESFIDPDNTIGTSQDAYDTLDARIAYTTARIAYTTASGAAEIFVGGTNLTNEAVVANGVTSPPNGSQIVTYKPPRQYYIGVRVNV